VPGTIGVIVTQARSRGDSIGVIKKEEPFCISVSRDPIGVILPGGFAKGGDYIDWCECVEEVQEVQDSRRTTALRARVTVISSPSESCEAIPEVGSKL
jgi:hypothetical protein